MRFFGFVLIYFFAELGLFVLFAQEFGFWTLVAEILLSGIGGFFLLTSSLSGSSEGIVDFFRNARNPKEFFASNLTKVVGAFLLIVPGLLSDSVGVLLSFGLFDGVLVALIDKILPKQENSANQESYSEIIDVEVIEENERIEDEKSHYRK